MKIRAPRIRFTRKVLIISVGILALLGGSGAAALYAGADRLMEKAENSPIGAACTTIQTMVLKTPAKRLWLRKYIRMQHADGATRIRTALRVAGLLAKANPVDLVQVSVLDVDGPTVRAQMRGRAIGAEVVIALQPQYLPDMKEPFIVRYYEGMPSAEGRYYGQRVSLDVAEIQKLMAAMRDVPGKEDCAEPEKPQSAEAEGEQHGKPTEHGEQVVSVEGEAPADHGEQAEATDHGATEGEQAKDHEAAPAEEPSFLDSVLGLVGLGGAEEAPAEGHEAKATDTAPAVADDEPIPEQDHSSPDAKLVPEKAAQEEPKAGDHAEAEPASHEVAPAHDETH